MSRVTNLNTYLPIFIRDVKEYEELSKVESPILDDIHQKLVEDLIQESFLTTMSEKRLAEWERELGITPSAEASIASRRGKVLSMYRGLGKLNSTLISAIVNAFTGGSAKTEFDNGILTVKISPPDDTFLEFDISDVVAELTKRTPAHLLLNIQLTYSSWNDIKNNIDSWGTVASDFETWEELKNFYAQNTFSLRNR